MSEKRLHFEEFLYIPALRHDAALIAWGGFYFDVKEENGKEEWELPDSSKVEKRVGRKEVIGEKALPYFSHARVELKEINGDDFITLHVAGANHAVVTGLKPDTAYAYRVLVRDEDDDWFLIGDFGRGVRKLSKDERCQLLIRTRR